MGKPAVCSGSCLPWCARRKSLETRRPLVSIIRYFWRSENSNGYISGRPRIPRALTIPNYNSNHPITRHHHIANIQDFWNPDTYSICYDFEISHNAYFKIISFFFWVCDLFYALILSKLDLVDLLYFPTWLCLGIYISRCRWPCFQFVDAPPPHKDPRILHFWVLMCLNCIFGILSSLRTGFGCGDLADLCVFAFFSYCSVFSFVVYSSRCMRFQCY